MKMYVEIPKGTEIEGRNDEILVLQEGLKLQVNSEIIHNIDIPELDIYQSGCNLDFVINNIKYDLSFGYYEYGLEEDKKLYGDAVKLKYKMLELLKQK